jgi:uncharacterized membrane protein YuzA (DUF378 family)
MLAVAASVAPVVLSAQTAPATTAEPRVVSVFNLTKGSAGTGGSTELKDALKIKIGNLKGWREKNATAELHLFLAGTELKNVVAVATSSDAGDPAELSAVKVTLDVDNDEAGINRKAWVQVLQAAIVRSNHEVDVSVGPRDQTPFPAEPAAQISLDVFPWYTWLVVVFLALVAVGVAALGKFTNMLRDSNGAANPPYSLAKHQMAVWFVVIVGSYLYVWLITGQFSAISTTALILIGISGVTGLLAVSMDAAKRTDAVKTRAQLQAEHHALDKTLNDPAAGLTTQLRAAAPGSPEATLLTATITPKLARRQELKMLLSVPVLPSDTNRWWLIDLLTDDSGVSFHRLQMAIWTLVLVMVFIRAVYADILMPDFDSTLLGLLGISSGTYLGFKFPEQPS